jgi:hypothetical protein
VLDTRNEEVATGAVFSAVTRRPAYRTKSCGIMYLLLFCCESPPDRMRVAALADLRYFMLHTGLLSMDPQVGQLLMKSSNASGNKRVMPVLFYCFFSVRPFLFLRVPNICFVVLSCTLWFPSNYVDKIW